MFYNLLKRSRQRRTADMPNMSLRTRGDELYLKGYVHDVNTGKNKVRVQEAEDTFIPDLVSNKKHEAPISAGYRRTISATTGKLLAVVFLCLLVLKNIKSSSASTEDLIQIDKRIIMEGDMFCLKYKQAKRNGLCWVQFGKEMVSSTEKQDERNLTVASSETWCTMCLSPFKLESAIFVHLNADSCVKRIVKNEVFGEILQNKLVVYSLNELDSNIKIITVGQNIQCYIQLSSMNDSVKITPKEYGNMNLTTSFVEFEKADICSYNLTCSMEEMNYSIIHEIENCSGKSGISTFGIICIVVGSLTIIVMIFRIIWKCKDKTKQQCPSRKHSEVYDVYELQHTEEEGKHMHLKEPESEVLSNTVRASFLPSQKDKNVSTSINLDL